ncbi:MAG: PIN domain-containing protein [Planctomycetia bacterium]
MAEKTFLDTNILVYAFDRSEPRKRETAIACYVQAFEDDTLVVSTQVLNEFCVTARRKSFHEQTIRKLIDSFCNYQVVSTDLLVVKRALDASKEYGLSHWDALIVAAAERAKCRCIYSEDMNHSQEYFGVRVENPFLGIES